MRYYLILKKPDGLEIPTACYDTKEQAERMAAEQARNWWDQDGEWFLKTVNRYWIENGETYKPLKKEV